MAKKKVDAKDFIAAMNASAENLYAVRLRIRTKEERFKQETDADYAEEKALKADILAALKTIGLSSVKTAAGESYSISHTHDFVVKNPIAYDGWVKDHRFVREDKVLVKQGLTKALKEGTLPEFVEAVPRETISVRAPKADKPNEESM